MTFEPRLAGLRAEMNRRGVTHLVVHGNIFNHDALTWLTHFTPKLGPAYALVPAEGPLRLLFSGGPGMKPSAQRLTWIEDVAALRSIRADATRWIEETAVDGPVRVGVIEGTAILAGDWAELEKCANGAIEQMDEAVEEFSAVSPLASNSSGSTVGAIQAAAEAELKRLAKRGADLKTALIEMERVAYGRGAQEVRVLAGRRPQGPPTRLPDGPLYLNGPTEVAIFIRADGMWSQRQFRLEPPD